MKALCIYLLAFVLCVPISMAGTQGIAMVNAQASMSEAGDDMSANSMSDSDMAMDCHNHEQMDGDTCNHDCCDQDASLQDIATGCDGGCENCDNDMGGMSLALVSATSSVAADPSNNIRTASPGIPTPPVNGRLIPPIS